MTRAPRPDRRPVVRQPGLGDPSYAAFAWRRFRRILALMGAFSILFSVAAVFALTQAYGPLGLIAILAVFGGSIGSIMAAALLMGLAFLSSGSGHDEAVEDIEPPNRS